MNNHSSCHLKSILVTLWFLLFMNNQGSWISETFEYSLIQLLKNWKNDFSIKQTKTQNLIIIQGRKKSLSKRTCVVSFFQTLIIYCWIFYSFFLFYFQTYNFTKDFIIIFCFIYCQFIFFVLTHFLCKNKNLIFQ